MKLDASALILKTLFVVGESNFVFPACPLEYLFVITVKSRNDGVGTSGKKVSQAKITNHVTEKKIM